MIRLKNPKPLKRPFKPRLENPDRIRIGKNKCSKCGRPAALIFQAKYFCHTCRGSWK